MMVSTPKSKAEISTSPIRSGKELPKILRSSSLSKFTFFSSMIGIRFVFEQFHAGSRLFFKIVCTNLIFLSN